MNAQLKANTELLRRGQCNDFSVGWYQVVGVVRLLFDRCFLCVLVSAVH